MPYDLTQVKVLIVDDMQAMLALTVSLLKNFGFKSVDGARSAEEGYQLFQQHNHDIVITDWLMEPMDGLQLIQMIRKRDDSPNKFVPIILMTGYSDRPRVMTARDQGTTEFLMKPYTVRDMYARITQIIEKPRQFVEAGEFFGPDRRRKRNFEYSGADKRDIGEKNADNWPNKIVNEEEAQDADIALRALMEETKKL